MYVSEIKITGVTLTLIIVIETCLQMSITHRLLSKTSKLSLTNKLEQSTLLKIYLRCDPLILCFLMYTVIHTFSSTRHAVLT